MPGPPKEFGHRRPPQAEPPAPVKRSHHVALLLMGTIAVGGGAYALMPSENCDPNRPGISAASGPTGNCSPRQSSSSSGGGRGSWGRGSSSSRANFFGGDASSGPSGVSASDAGSGHIAHGGFGSVAQAFASHFSGGG
jgi:hypothetical protein